MEGESGGQTVVADNTNSQVDGVSLQHWAEITCLLENSIVRSDCTVCHNLAKRGGGVDFRDLLLAANSACRSCLVVCFALRHFDSPGRQRFTRIIVYASPFGSITLYAAGYTCINFYVEPNEQNEAYTMTGNLVPPTAASRLANLPDSSFPWRSNATFALTGISESSPWRDLRFSLPVDCDPSSAATFKKISAWLSCCLKTHPKCSFDPTSLPTRVIDVTESEDSDGSTYCRLYVTKRESADYIALSHCWGSPDLIFKTTSDTLESNKVRLPWNKLSRTFQEAITMTRRLGVRYLWIDSICIIQENAEDWDFEAANMGNVYKNAYLTLAATASSSGAGGLFVARDGDDLEFPLPGSTHSNTALLRSRRQRHHSSLPDGHGLVRGRTKADPLSCRAWAYQERLLSRRILHFNSQELVWECKTAQTCECGQLEGTEKNIFENLLSNRAQTWNENSWRMLVSNYTRLELTYNADRLPALSGIASQIFQESDYLAGLSREFLLSDFGWFIHRDASHPVSRQLGAPSWSWASVNAPVTWNTDGSIENIHSSISSNLKIVKASIKAEGRNPFGQVSDAILIISGMVLEATLLPLAMHHGYIPQWSYTGLIRLQTGNNNITNTFVPDCTVSDDYYFSTQSVLLLICSLSSKLLLLQTQTMVLRRVEREDIVYERIGVAHFQHRRKDRFEFAETRAVTII